MQHVTSDRELEAFIGLTGLAVRIEANRRPRLLRAHALALEEQGDRDLALSSVGLSSP